jgi:aminoglycoside 2'-N-acetyltransferase I
MMSRLEVVPADALDPAARREIINLCESAFEEDFSRLFELLPGSVHVLVREDGGRLVSHAEWVTRWLQADGLPLLRTAYVEAVATARDRQRQGLGATVLRRVTETLVVEPRWELAALSPSYPDFYTRLGWELWHGPLAIRRDAGIEPSPAGEQVMILRLPRTPAALDITARLTAEWREGELW